MKIRLGFTSVNNLHRQILVTVDSNATSGIDFGYDAENFENHVDDMYWMIDDRKFIIQGTNHIDETTILPIGLHTGANGNNTISIEELINVPEDLEFGVLDKETNTFYDIKQCDSFTIELPAGEYLSRFEFIFINNDQSEDGECNCEEEEETDHELDIEETDRTDNLDISFINSTKSISIKNLGVKTIKSVQVFSLTGELVAQFINIDIIDKSLIHTYDLNPGNYILIVSTNKETLSKKVLIQ